MIFNKLYIDRFYVLTLNIEELVDLLPSSITKKNHIFIPDQVWKRFFHFLSLNENDVLIHFNCGKNNAIKIAIENYSIKKAVGFENDMTLRKYAKNNIKNFQQANILSSYENYDLSDTTVVLFTFVHNINLDDLIKKFETELQNDVRIGTFWGPLGHMLPQKVNFPFILAQKPFRYSADIRDQIQYIYGTRCIDFTASWVLAEKYIKTFGTIPEGHLRFVNMLMSMIIWINAWNLEVTCEEEIPPPVETYLGILKTFFNIDLSDLFNRK